MKSKFTIFFSSLDSASGLRSPLRGS